MRVAKLFMTMFRRISETPRWTNLYFLYGCTSLIWAASVSNVLRSSWSGDDWPNSQTPYWILWRFGKITPTFVWTEAMHQNQQWMEGVGRFYPLAHIEGRFAFSYFRTLWEYKLLQGGVLFVAGILFALLVYLISRSHSLALVTLLSLNISVQFRPSFDPHVAFLFLIPSLLTKVFIASILLYLATQAKNFTLGLIYSFLSAAVFFAAMSTYEYAFLLFPILIITFIAGWARVDGQGIEKIIRRRTMDKKTLRMFSLVLPVIFSWLGYGLFVFGYLRPKAVAISGAYVLGISSRSIPVFFSQLVASIPLSVVRKSDVPHQGPVLWFAIIFATAGSYFVLKLLVQGFAEPKSGYLRMWESSRLKNVGLNLIVLTMLAAPAFMLSIQPAWWGKASVTNTYLGVLIEEFGIGLGIGLLVNSLLKSILKPAPTLKPTRGRKN